VLFSEVRPTQFLLIGCLCEVRKELCVSLLVRKHLLTFLDVFLNVKIEKSVMFLLPIM